MPTYTPKVAFITGASSGFGAAIARRLAGLGARVVISARRRDRLEALAAELGDKAHAITLDVRDEQAVNAAVATLPPAFAAIDVLVNNAGLAAGIEPAHATQRENWARMVDTNINGLLYVTRAILPGMVERDRGHVVNIGSVAGTYPYAGGNVYGATKAFVEQFSLNLRCDLLGKQVRVTNIEPGMAETEFSVVRFGGDAEKAKAVYQGVTPLSGDDIAEAVAWCVTLPAHVNINRLEVMPTMQVPAGFSVHRRPG